MVKHRDTTYENARTYVGENGLTYAHSSDAMDLARMIASSHRELLDRLSDSD